MKHRKFPRFATVVFIVGGTLFTCVGVFLTWKMWSFARSAKAVVGKIEGLERRRSYAPVFSFRDAGGGVHQVTSLVDENKSTYAVGQEVPVLYDAANPDDASIHTFKQMWLGPLLVCLVGMVQLGIGIVAHIWRR